MMVEKLCKNCKHWERYSENNHNFDETNDKRGKCSSPKFIDSSGYEYFDDEGNELILGANDTLEYHDHESYKAAFSTGENFGCIHFEKGETK